MVLSCAERYVGGVPRSEPKATRSRPKAGGSENERFRSRDGVGPDSPGESRQSRCGMLMEHCHTDQAG